MSFQSPSNTIGSGTTTGGFALAFNNSSNNANVLSQASTSKEPTFGTIATIPTTNTTSVPASGVTTATFGLGGSALNFGSTTVTTATPTSFSSAQTIGTLPTTTTTIMPSNFGFGATGGVAAITTSTIAAPTLSAALAVSSVPSTTGIRDSITSLSTSTKTTDSSAINTTTQLTYNQLEDCINKWTLELEDQEKMFIDQATQINAWDRILVNNNQKILELNEAVQKVKNDQQSLEQELEFIEAQHKEVQDTIAPLQKQFTQMPLVDIERSRTYLLAENLDAQIKQMAEDLKELIDNLNENSKCQDNTDPIIQIGKILNAHMNSLQWIERSTNTIADKLDEITKMHEKYKRDAERSFRATYYN